MKRGVATALLFASLAAILGVLLIRMRGQAPLPEWEPPSSFSAVRAITFEHEILGGDEPHPVGTAAHDAIRDRLAARFREFGYDVTIQRSFVCSPFVICAPIANVIARIPGDTRPDALVLAAHYDSVPAGPGVTDDGIGVATLVETARALRSEHFRNPIVYLITDAEEVALLGAEGFVADPAYLRGTAAVINVEARGTDGPSFLFETSRQNAGLARAIARSLPHPATSSFYYDIYELLPNDTDLTVFKRAGFAGIGFGNIGHPVHYHTPLDNFAHASPSTLQHHGDHVLAMARALAAMDLRQPGGGNAVWFDVLTFFMVSWPQYLSLGLAIASFVILLVAAFTLKTRPRAITIGVGSFFLSLVAAFLVALAGNWLAGLRAGGATWLAHPGPAIGAAWFIGALMTIFVAQRLVARAGIDGLFFGQALCWSAIAVALSIVLPGGSYLTLVPALACAVCLIWKMNDGVVAVICASAAAIVLFPFGLALYDALAGPILPIVSMLIALVTTTFAPLLASMPRLRRPLNASLAAGAVACIAMSLIVPAHEANSPRHLNLEYVDDGAAPRWQTDALLPAIQAAAHFNPTPQPVYEWSVPPYRALVAPAPALGLTPTELQVVRDDRNGGRHLTLHLRSTRNAPRVALLFRAPSFAALRVNGITPPPMPRTRSGLAPGWHRVSVRGASEATIEIDLTRDEPIDAVAVDSSFGLPAAGTALAHARDASVAVPAQEGDLTTTIRRIRL